MELEEKLEYFKNKGYTYNKYNGAIKSPSGNIVHNIIANNNCIKVKLYEFAWYYTYNTVPERIEHLNGNKSDNRINNLLNITETLKCKKCGKELLKSKFSTFINKSNNKLYYKRACKKCLHKSIKNEEYYTLDHEILLHYMTEEEIIKIEKLINNEKFTYNGIKLKRCSKCGMLKSVAEFNFVNINKQLRQSWCKLCGLNYQKNKKIY